MSLAFKENAIEKLALTERESIKALNKSLIPQREYFATVVSNTINVYNGAWPGGFGLVQTYTLPTPADAAYLDGSGILWVTAGMYLYKFNVEDISAPLATGGPYSYSFEQIQNFVKIETTTTDDRVWLIGKDSNGDQYLISVVASDLAYSLGTNQVLDYTEVSELCAFYDEASNQEVCAVLYETSAAPALHIFSTDFEGVELEVHEDELGATSTPRNTRMIYDAIAKTIYYISQTKGTVSKISTWLKDPIIIEDVMYSLYNTGLNVGLSTSDVERGVVDIEGYIHSWHDEWYSKRTQGGRTLNTSRHLSSVASIITDLAGITTVSTTHQVTPETLNFRPDGFNYSNEESTIIVDYAKYKLQRCNNRYPHLRMKVVDEYIYSISKAGGYFSYFGGRGLELRNTPNFIAGGSKAYIDIDKDRKIYRAQSTQLDAYEGQIYATTGSAVVGATLTLPSSSVATGLAVDVYKSIFVASEDTPTSYLSKVSQFFNIAWTIQLNSTIIYDIVADNKGGVLIGTSANEYRRYDSDGNLINSYTHPNDVIDVCTNGKYVYTACTDNYVRKISGNSLIDSYLVPNTLQKIDVDHSGRLFVTARDSVNNLNYFILLNQNFEVVTTTSYSSTTSINKMILSKTGFLYLIDGPKVIKMDQFGGVVWEDSDTSGINQDDITLYDYEGLAAWSS